MSDNLTVFGTDYTGVAGIKAKGTGNGTLTYIRPTGTKSISANGTSIDVTEYASVDVSVSAPSPTLQTVTKSYTPTETAQSETVTADTGYDGIAEVAVTVGAISSTYVGSGITRRSSSDLTASGATVSVPAGYYASAASKAVSGGMNVQAYTGYATRKATSYGATSATLTVKTTGTYTVSWVAWRSSSQGTMGTNLYVNSTAGTNNETFIGTYGQCITLTGQHYNANDVLTIYATSGSTSRTLYVANLVIVQTA